jgi:hypothetical protein
MRSIRGRLLTAFTLALMAIAAQAQQASRIVSTEIALETEAGAVNLPSTGNGTLVLSACQGCPPQTFLATASTSYLLGEKPVSLAEFRSALTGKPQTFMTVTYSVKTKELTRVTASINP